MKSHLSFYNIILILICLSCVPSKKGDDLSCQGEENCTPSAPLAPIETNTPLDPINPSVQVDPELDMAIANLQKAIDDTQAFLNTIEIGAGAGQYASAEMLNQALEAAIILLNSNEFDIQSIASITSQLKLQIESTKSSLIPVPDKKLLNSILSEAIALLDETIEGNAVGMCSSACKSTLKQSIDIATSITENSKANQTEVDTAKQSLESAVMNFKHLIVLVGNKDLLSTLLQNAKNELTRYKDKTLSSNEIEALNILKSNMVSARNAIASNKFTQVQVDRIANNLSSALEAMQSISSSSLKRHSKSVERSHLTSLYFSQRRDRNDYRMSCILPTAAFIGDEINSDFMNVSLDTKEIQFTNLVGTVSEASAELFNQASLQDFANSFPGFSTKNISHKGSIEDVLYNTASGEFTTGYALAIKHRTHLFQVTSASMSQWKLTSYGKKVSEKLAKFENASEKLNYLASECGTHFYSDRIYGAFKLTTHNNYTAFKTDKKILAKEIDFLEGITNIDLNDQTIGPIKGQNISSHTKGNSIAVNLDFSINSVIHEDLFSSLVSGKIDGKGRDIFGPWYNEDSEFALSRQQEIENKVSPYIIQDFIVAGMLNSDEFRTTKDQPLEEKVINTKTLQDLSKIKQSLVSLYSLKKDIEDARKIINSFVFRLYDEEIAIQQEINSAEKVIQDCESAPSKCATEIKSFQLENNSQKAKDISYHLKTRVIESLNISVEKYCTQRTKFDLRDSSISDEWEQTLSALAQSIGETFEAKSEEEILQLCKNIRNGLPKKVITSGLIDFEFLLILGINDLKIDASPSNSWQFENIAILGANINRLTISNGLNLNIDFLSSDYLSNLDFVHFINYRNDQDHKNFLDSLFLKNKPIQITFSETEEKSIHLDLAKYAPKSGEDRYQTNLMLMNSNHSKQKYTLYNLPVLFGFEQRVDECVETKTDREFLSSLHRSLHLQIRDQNDLKNNVCYEQIQRRCNSLPKTQFLRVVCD